MYRTYPNLISPKEEATLIRLCEHYGHVDYDGSKILFYEARSAGPGRFLDMHPVAHEIRERCNKLTGAKYNNLMIQRWAAGTSLHMHRDAKHALMSNWLDINLGAPTILRIGRDDIVFDPRMGVWQGQPDISDNLHGTPYGNTQTRWCAVFIEVEK